MKPYPSWGDFAFHMKHRESLVNFVTAYGQHPSVLAANTVADKRAAANEQIHSSEGDDIIEDLNGDDVLKGGPGNDAMPSGQGFDGDVNQRMTTTSPTSVEASTASRTMVVAGSTAPTPRATSSRSSSVRPALPWTSRPR